MIYTQEMLESMKKVEAAREANIALEPRRMTADEKDALLEPYHPDYRRSEFNDARDRPQQGRKGSARAGCTAPGQQPRLRRWTSILPTPIMTSMCWSSAAAARALPRPSRPNDGGRQRHDRHQAAHRRREHHDGRGRHPGGRQAQRFPGQHYLDAFGGGHFAAKPELLSKLVMDAPGRDPVAQRARAWSSTRRPTAR